MATITERLGEFAANVSISKLPSDVVEKAKSCLLWGLCGASTADKSYANNVMGREMAVSIASANPAAPGSGSTVLLGGAKVSLTDAAFGNGVLFDNTMCDSYLAATHFAPAVLPPVLAIAEQQESPGTEVIAAIVAGYEVAAAMTKDHLAPTMDRGWRGALIFGVFGSAAASARMMGLSAEEAGNAIGFATGMACGSMEPMYARGMDNGFVMGVAARNGVTAAQIASRGGRAARTAVEGKAGFLVHFPGTTEFAERITPHLSKDWEILNVTFKRYEASGRAHSPMFLALKIAEEEDIDPNDIQAVELELNPFEQAYPPRRERDDEHMVTAVAGALTYRSGRGDLIVMHDNPTFLRVAERIAIRPGNDLKPLCARMTVKTSKGEYFREITNGPKSHALSYEGTADLARVRHEKMRISRESLEELVTYIRNFEQAPNVKHLVDLATMKV